MRSEFSLNSSHITIRERKTSSKIENDSDKAMHQNMEEASL